MEKFDEMLSFDDLLLIPQYSDVIPSEVDVSTKLTPSLELNIPIVSSAMDTVTEHRMAIAVAQEGGLGVIHRNISIEEQANEVRMVKRFEAGLISDPLTIVPNASIGEAFDIMRKRNISGLPVVDGAKLVGIITHRDLRFETDMSKKVADVMTPDLVTANVGIDFNEALKILHEHRIEKLPVVDKDGKLKGLITVKDIQKSREHPFAVKDKFGRLLVAAAVGVGDDLANRSAALVESGVDVIAIDTAHGDSKNVVEATKYIKKHYPEKILISGNVATADGTKRLIDAGADVIKVGVGPGSICTTRVVTGAGMPQASAINTCAKQARKMNVNIIADGGIRYSGDMTKAIGLGASVVMIGNLFAGADEAPGETVLYQGRRFKTYRGMGSLGAMRKGARDRYFQHDVIDERKLVPEGIEGRVPYKGPVTDVIYQLVGGVRAGMGMVGARNIPMLWEKAKFVIVTAAGVKESHPHDVAITHEAPNYRVR
ncbi:IMP dehydrogenase [bacterium]|nr:MAG: IMP dehydrogenase [bacterium]